MYVKFKQDVTVNVATYFGIDSSYTKRTFREGDILRAGSVSIDGEPKKKVKTRPGQPGGRKTLYRVSIHDGRGDDPMEQFMDVNYGPLDYFIIDSELIEVIPTTSPNPTVS